MRTKSLPGIALLFAAAALAGCGRDSVNSPAATNTSSLDRAQVAAVVASEPAVVEDNQFESGDPSTMGTAPAGTFSAIQPLTFWRRITSVERSFEFAFADSDSAGRPTTAIVTVHKRLAGSFDILTGTPRTDSTAADTSLEVIHKPLVDHWVRRILLRRFPASTRDGNPWHVVATSGVKVESRAAETRITSLRVQSAGVDTTFEDPLQLMFLRRIPRLDPGAQVTLTVTTLRNDDVVVMCMRMHRFRFHNNGDNTYTGVWTVPDPRMGDMGGPGPGPGGMMQPPILHFGVNALSRGTLFDDQAPYDSQAWILPFLLTPDQVADALP